MKAHYIVILCGFLYSCGSLNKGSLIVAEEIKPKIESTFQGIHAREKNEPVKKDRLIFDFHYSDWLGERNQVKTGWQSLGINGNLMLDFPLNKKSTVALATGIRLTHRAIQHNGYFLISDSINESILYPVIDFESPRSRQKFIQSLVEIPFEFRLRGEALNSYRLSLGCSIGLVYNSFEKWKEGTNRFREYNHPNRNLINAGVYMRLGMGKITFFGQYNFIPVFKGDISSKLNTFQLGIGLSLF